MFVFSALLPCLLTSIRTKLADEGTPCLICREHVIAALLLQFHHPGGVRVAGKGGAERGGKESTATGELDFPRARIDVEVRVTRQRQSR